MVAIAKNNTIYHPVVLFSNDTLSRNEVDELAIEDTILLIKLLHDEAIEVDRNDRINFLNGMATVGAQPGLRLLSVYGTTYTPERKQPLFSHDPSEMYDGMLNIGAPELVHMAPSYTRFRKDGQFTTSKQSVLGIVSGNVSPIDTLIDSVEKMLHVAKTQPVSKLDRLISNNSDDDLIL